MFRDSQHGYKNNVNRNIRMYCMYVCAYICTTNIHVCVCCLASSQRYTFLCIMYLCVLLFASTFSVYVSV